MSQQRVIVCTIGRGGHYPRLVSRQIDRFARNSPGYELVAWINALPYGAPESVIEDGWDYTAYCAKPFVLSEAEQRGADIGILLDAAFYPIRPIEPLVEWIHSNGYYFCKNGYKVGEWCSDRALEGLAISRENAMELDEISSYCVGLNFADPRCLDLLRWWRTVSLDRRTVPGPHTNNCCGVNLSSDIRGRNRGFVSLDPRVKGHRHDQTVLSVLAHRFINPLVLCERPLFTAYDGYETEKTVLVNDGRI